jgi:hypothetical protein
MYLHATLTSRPGKMSDLAATVGSAAAGMEGRGMRLLGAYQTIGGMPGQIIDLWELDDANAIVDALEGASRHPKHQQMMERLGESLQREELRLVERTDYCPPWQGPASPDARYLHASLTPRYGQVQRVSAIVAGLREVLETHLQWRLAGAYRTVIGDFGEIFDLWQIPAERTVDDMLIEARAIPAFAEHTRDLPTYVEAEKLLTMRATPYCP